jgi:hypothetical protein
MNKTMFVELIVSTTPFCGSPKVSYTITFYREFILQKKENPVRVGKGCMV